MDNGISRRAFMRKTVRAAGLTLAGRSVLLEPGRAGCATWGSFVAAPGALPPSDTIRFGIIGVGMQGSGLLRTAIRLPGVECVAACDLYDGRQELAKEIVDKPIPTTRRYHEFLENKDIDCLIAAVPDHWHKQVVVDACDAGKDIYCEKPMTHSPADGMAMVAAAKKTGRVVQIGSQRVSSVICANAKELLANGVISTLILV